MCSRTKGFNCKLYSLRELLHIICLANIKMLAKIQNQQC